MRKRLKFGKKSQSDNSFLGRIASILKVIKVELFIATIGLILSLGQYFQNSINVRINITSTWKEGYTAENRTLVTKFVYLSKNRKLWCKSDEKDKECNTIYQSALEKLATDDKLLEPLINNKSIKENEFLDCLVNFDISDTVDNQDKNKIADPEKKYLAVIHKYRNALIETLNTLEAVKAVIQSKPLPFRLTIFYRDTLEGRYRDIILELRESLKDFIISYREARPGRETPAWFVLTSDESYLNDFANVALYFLMFTFGLFCIYLIKNQMYKMGYLRDYKT